MPNPNGKSFTCKVKGCGFKATGPSTLGAHYHAHPSHRPKRSADNRTYVERKRKAAAKAAKANGARRGPYRKPNPKHPNVTVLMGGPGDPYRFCPNCGHRVGRLGGADE